MGESPHARLETTWVVAELFAALDARDPVDLVALELPYGLTPWLDAYVGEPDDSQAASVLAELRTSWTLTDGDVTLLDALRRHNATRPERPVHVGGWDVELDPVWTAAHWPGDVPGARDAAADVRDQILPGVEAFLELATSFTTGLPTRARADTTWTHLTGPDHLGRFVSTGRVLLFGGSEHTATKRGCRREMQGCRRATSAPSFSVQVDVLDAVAATSPSCGNDGGRQPSAGQHLDLPGVRRRVDGAPNRVWLRGGSRLSYHHDELVVIRSSPEAVPDRAALAYAPARPVGPPADCVDLTIFAGSRGHLDVARQRVAVGDAVPEPAAEASRGWRARAEEVDGRTEVVLDAIVAGQAARVNLDLPGAGSFAVENHRWPDRRDLVINVLAVAASGDGCAMAGATNTPP